MSPAVETQLTPGQQLKQVRIAKGVTLAQISKRILIIESRLEALENDDYSAAGGAATYVVGYVKLYAGIVGLDPKSLTNIIKIIDTHFEQAKLEKKLESYVIIKPASRFPWLSIAAAILAVIIFIGLGQWFFSQESKPLLAVESPVNDLSRALFESSSLARMNPENIQLSNDLVDDIDASDSQSSSLAEEVATIAPKFVTPSETFNDVAPEIASASNMATTLVNSSPSVTAGSADQLTLNFSGDCWLEVFDATHKKIFSRLVNSGELISLIGAAPFDVKVGNAAVVKLSVNGRAIDLNPPEGQRVLRLQVGP